MQPVIQKSSITLTAYANLVTTECQIPTGRSLQKLHGGGGQLTRTPFKPNNSNTSCDQITGLHLANISKCSKSKVGIAPYVQLRFHPVEGAGCALTTIIKPEKFAVCYVYPAI